MAQNPVYVGAITSIINRLPVPIFYTYDGRRYELKPGENHVTDDHIRYAYEQNVIPGTADPYQPHVYQSFVGIPNKTDCSAIPKEMLDLLWPERLDRSKFGGNRAHEKLSLQHAAAIPKGRVGMEAPSTGVLEPGKFGGNE
jgi:hypothetical protein